MDVCIENVFPAVAAPFNSFHDDVRESKGHEADAAPTTAIPHIVHVAIDEFFAVASEVFFVAGSELLGEHPALYDLLAGYYRQDPAVQ